MKTINRWKKYYLNVLGLLMFAPMGNNAFAVDCSSATMIYSLPYYAASPGNYCLADNMTFITTWNSTVAAITINADNVTVDFNGKTVTGRWAGPTPAAGTEIGVTVTGNAKNAVIRNGTLKGLKTGISIWSNVGSNNVDNLTIEQMNITEIAGMGINVGLNSRCDNCDIHNNIISIIDANLCTTCGGYSGAYGIYMQRASNLNISDNVINSVISRGPLSSYGIYVTKGSNATVDANTVIDDTPSTTQDTAIQAFSYQGMDASSNMLMNFYRGIRYSYSTGVYCGTIYSNVTIPYTGGTSCDAN